MTLGSLYRVLLHCLIPVIVGTGCSLLYDAGAQCTADSDCVKLWKQVPELSGSTCKNAVCVLPSEESHACESHADCVSQANGDPAICRNYSCVSLLHGECRQVLNADALATSNDVILLGAFAPLNNQLPAQDTVLMSYQLALDEVQKYTKGAAGYGDAFERPFVIVACQSDDANQLADSFDHLTKTLKVPVVVTNQQATVLEEQVSRLIHEQTNTMFLSPLSSDPALSVLEDEGRLWHLLGAPTDLAPAFEKLIGLQSGRVSSSQVRVLTVVNDVRAMEQIADLVEATLKIDGLSVPEARVAKTYKRVAVESLALHPDPDTSALYQALTEFKPNVVVLLAGPEVIEPGIIATENNWQSWGLTEAPEYVLSHHLFNNVALGEGLASLGGSEARMYGINFAGAEDPSLYEGYLSRLDGKYSDAYVKGYENYYDAAHFAMLSVIGVAKNTATEDITGDLAVKGFRRLIDENGAKYDLWPANLSTIAAFLEAQATATVYLTGTLGAPDFNTDGSRNSAAALWCMKRSSNGVSYLAGAVRFDRDTGEFTNGLEACAEASP